MSQHHLHLKSRLWRVARRHVLDRDGYRCRKCGRAGRLEVDHVVPLKRGGAPWEEDNLQALCKDCHIVKTRSENRRPETPAEAAWRRLVASMMSTSTADSGP